MNLFSFIASALITLTPALCSAEILQNIEPLDTLGDIKLKYPNAALTRVKAAWVTEDQDFFKLTGQGFPGELFIAFSDGRPNLRKLAKVTKKRMEEQGPDASSLVLDMQEKFANESDDDALNVQWVRWAPPSPIPLERYKSKYGEPSKCDFTNDTMQPYCEWSTRGILVKLSDDRKLVFFVEASFTIAEQRAAYQKRGWDVPLELKEEVPSKKPTANVDGKKGSAAKSLPAATR